MPTTIPQKALWNLGQLSAHLGWSQRFLDALLRSEDIPSTNIAGEKYFDPDIVIEWFEVKLHSLGHARIVDWENSIKTPAIDNEEHPPVTLQLSKVGVLLDVHIEGRDHVLRRLANLAKETSSIRDSDALYESLIERENILSTALPGSVAICHPRNPAPQLTDKPVIRVIRTATPLAFSAEEPAGTSLFFLLVSTTSRGHLQTLARLARILNEETKAALIAARNTTDFYAIISQREVTINKKRLLLQNEPTQP